MIKAKLIKDIQKIAAKYNVNIIWGALEISKQKENNNIGSVIFSGVSTHNDILQDYVVLKLLECARKLDRCIKEGLKND